MKKLYVLIAIISLATISKSQTLTSNLFPCPGDVFKYFYTDTLAIVAGPGGTAQVWNFEDLYVDTVLQNDIYIGPLSTTPPVNGQTTATGDSTSGYLFYKNTATEFSMLGFSDSANVNVVAYSDLMIMVPFPFSYNNTHTDNFAFTTTFQGNNVNATGTITATADGTGNLLLPQGAYNNVLRVKYNVVTNLSVLIFNVTQTQTIYEWYDGVYKFPLLHIETTETTDPFGGAPTYDKTVYVEATGPAGIRHMQMQADFKIAPNPAEDQVKITFNETFTGKTTLLISNALGQIVYENSNVDSRLSNVNINTSDLGQGVYFVTLIQNNKTSSKKLVVR